VSEQESVFPREGELRRYPDRDGVYWSGSAGLSKRELFAALAMAKIARPSLTGEALKLRAKICVAHADALIAALKEGK